MGKCLVTKLNGAVDNFDLLKIGEFRINVTSAPNPSKLTQGMDLQFTEPTEVSIVGDGYFTDENLSANYGKVKTITNERFFISNGNYELSIKNKYKVSLISGINRNVSGDLNGEYKSFNIDGLKYSNSLMWIDSITAEGDISAFENALSLIYIGLSKTNITGDISAFANNTALTTVFLTETNITGDISAFANNTALTLFRLDKTNITGDISAFANKTALNDIGLSETYITGDISALANNTALIVFRLSKTNITGDISAFENMTKLEILEINYTSVHGDIGAFRNCPLQEIRIANVGNLTGDFAKLPAKCYYIALGNDASKTVLNWTNRDTSEYITAWSGYAKVTNVDDMLIGMAKCTAHPNVTTFPTWKKTISILGTRTSASDSALVTLQQKGYTVSVTQA